MIYPGVKRLLSEAGCTLRYSPLLFFPAQKRSHEYAPFFFAFRIVFIFFRTAAVFPIGAYHQPGTDAASRVADQRCPQPAS